MSKKLNWKSQHNQYYAEHEIAPPECIGRITCRHLNRNGFRRIIKACKGTGCYYNHDKNDQGYWYLEIATESKEHTSLIINSLKAQAIAQGVQLN